MSDAIARAYDRWSTSYDVDRNPTRDLDAVTLRRASLPVSDADVLEIGCGTGKNTEWLASQAHRLTSIFTEAARVVRVGGTVYFAELHPFRQWRGGQAHFTAADTGAVVHVPPRLLTVQFVQD